MKNVKITTTHDAFLCGFTWSKETMSLVLGFVIITWYFNGRLKEFNS